MPFALMGNHHVVALDHIIAWNLTFESNSEVHCVGSDCIDHALISYTVGRGLLTYRDPVDQAQDTGKPKLKKIDPKQLPCILSKLNAIMRPIAKDIHKKVKERRMQQRAMDNAVGSRANDGSYSAYAQESRRQRQQSARARSPQE